VPVTTPVFVFGCPTVIVGLLGATFFGLIVTDTATVRVPP
jgi:hypothetical protein